jgi:predicted transcriptional regulator
MSASEQSEPQVCGVSIFSKRHATVLADIGAALLIIKTQRGLTLVEMGEDIRKSDDTVARYIAGEKEMGVVTWLRACEIYPELPDLIVEAERRRLAEQPAKYKAAMAEVRSPMERAA